MMARRRADAHPFGEAALWLLFAIVPTGALLLALAGPDNLNQLAAAATATDALSQFGFLGLGPLAANDWPLVVFAAIGSLLILRRRTTELWVWPFWVAATMAVLIGYAPVWYHHYLLLSVAACP